MPDEPCSILDDKRTVREISWPENSSLTVGINGVTRIEVYREAGHMGYVPWIAIYRGDAVHYRVHADQVLVVYAHD